MSLPNPNLNYSNVSSDRFSSEQYPLITQKRWEAIVECKKRFLQNEESYCNDYLRKEIVESWQKSRKLGIDPNIKLTKSKMNSAEYKKIVENNRSLIEIISPLLNTFKNMAIFTSGYILYLCDRDGTFLIQEGEMGRIPTEGLVWDENTIGTCVHSLCVSLKRPVQMMGPEHYNVALNNILAFAAPIMNEAGEIIATLILGQPLIDRPWLESFQNANSHTLGLITSLAVAVEGQLKLIHSNISVKESYQNLKIAHENLSLSHATMKAISNFMDEGIIAIDRTGTIIHTNQEGARIFKIEMGEKGNRNIKEFLCSHSRLRSLIEEGRSTTIEEPLCIENDEHSYMIHIQPIFSPGTEHIDVAVLRFNPVEKINAMVASRSGAVANYNFEDLMGKSKELKRSIDLAQRFANLTDNILLIGESGTGKELFAQAIHNTYRPQGPFMAVNCAAMPRELIESELFGYEGGSFTGAERSGRPGKIELANGGTLFLDEIGDMPLEIQAVLLRTLEDKQVMRVGGRRYKKVDFRLISATNKDLYSMVKEKQYREDLYFRLSVLTINIPPLRNRGNDIEILYKYFIEKYCKKQGWKIPKITPETEKIINEYKWPGNVRQLQNAMTYAVNTAQKGQITPDCLPNYIMTDTTPISNDKMAKDEMLRLDNLEKMAIETALLRSDNNMDRAVEILGISRSTLYRKLKEYQIQHKI
ncbi:sigma-54 interaction domain-containing protein [Desulfitobacterium metallireducens]|uniref:ArsR family transcriptional regulator n=1 Tax=Desulfitobacterium metallireducens DSM 15288 TaxID=871968 RepID=W0E9Q8_9FIRM|nr:sigma 54-interacting transcriptional regulator [Desulfitobacterium metallireducens]AHF05781.1 ArsR family transcriptional regulator [Desulfitobacterium metallireducens DSM 15288]